MNCIDQFFRLYFSIAVFEILECHTVERFPRRVNKNKTIPSIINLRYRSPEYVLRRITNQTNVVRLILENDKLTELPRSLADLTNLRSVSLADNRITDVSKISFLNDLPRLQWLSLSKNPLKSLKGLRVFSLINLEAQRSAIEEIDDLLPNSLPSLVTLNLTGNPLGTVRKLISETLTELVLKDCRLTNLPSDSFEGLTNLTYLDLRDNQLRTLPDDIFSGNNYLRYLMLGNNSLMSVKNAWFNETKNLQTLDLSENKIGIINETTFAKLSDLVNLDLEGNNVKSLPNLKTAAINMNLSKNFIKNEKIWDLTEMTRIRRLDLSHNHLNGECGAFRSTSMGVLILGYNNITSIAENSLIGLPNLTDLNLKGNRFTTAINPSIFEKNRMLRNVELDNNPWTCNCDQLYRIYLYLATGQKTKTMRLICTNPINASGQTWWDFCAHDWRDLMVVEDHVERSKNWMIAISSIFGACLIIGTIVYIIYTYKKNRSQIQTST